MVQHDFEYHSVTPLILMKKLLFIPALLLFTSCTISRFHEFGYTPANPGRYPQFTSQDYLKGRLDEYRAGYDVTFYDLDIYLYPDKYIIGGEVTIHLTAVSKLKKIRFDLHRNLEIRSLKFKGEAVPFVREERAVIASLPDSLETGKTYNLAVVFEGKPVRAKNPPWSGGVVWNEDKNGNPWIGIACENEGGSIWFPCKDHISDEPDSVSLRITVPEGLQAVSNGILENHTSKPGSETYIWKTRYPVNIYNITFYAGRFEHFSDTMKTGEGILSLDYYVLPENLQKAKEHFMQVKDIIKVYSGCFGPYPWIEEVFRLVEGPFEGMEHQTAIAYGSGYVNLKSLGGDYLIVHEAAHEWWGNAVSVSDFSDIWLQEGFATYSEMIFAEKIKGYENSLKWARLRLAGMINNKRPVVGPPDVSFWDTRDNDVYNKGALILHTIRNIVNDSCLFFDIMQTFYREHAAKSQVATTDFIEVVERKTGKDWGRFFDAYLYRREVPVLSWCSGTYNNEKYPDKPETPFIAAKWTNVPDGFTMPVSMSCAESEYSVIIEVSTEPALYYMEENKSGNKWICNRELSYFKAVKDKNILKEITNGN